LLNTFAIYGENSKFVFFLSLLWDFILLKDWLCINKLHVKFLSAGSFGQTPGRSSQDQAKLAQR